MKKNQKNRNTLFLPTKNLTNFNLNFNFIEKNRRKK